jgi:hypothetical protein
VTILKGRDRIKEANKGLCRPGRPREVTRTTKALYKLGPWERGHSGKLQSLKATTTARTSGRHRSRQVEDGGSKYLVGPLWCPCQDLCLPNNRSKKEARGQRAQMKQSAYISLSEHRVAQRTQKDKQKIAPSCANPGSMVCSAALSLPDGEGNSRLYLIQMVQLTRKEGSKQIQHERRGLLGYF